MMFTTEEDVKIKLVVSYLKTCGFDESELSFEKNFTLHVGRSPRRVDSEEKVKPARPRLDILVRRAEKNLFVVEVKADDLEITSHDVDQVTSYAKLLHPVAPVAIITNGKKWRVVDSISKRDLEPQQLFGKANSAVSLPDEAYYEALKNFLGYSKENLLRFCEWQVGTYMRQLRGSAEEPTKKYIPEVYEPSKKLEEPFSNFLRSASNCFVVVGDSGVGKTCWICDSALKSLADGSPTFFYRHEDLRRGVLAAIADDLNWTLSPQFGEAQAAKRFFELFEGKRVMIFIDEFDKMEPADARKIAGDFLRRISGADVKLVASCKATSWPRLLEFDGDPTVISEEVFKVDGQKGYWMIELEDGQLVEMIKKYRDFYGFEGIIEDRVIQDCKRSPYLLRIMFEVACRERLPDLTYTTRHFYYEYFQQIKSRFEGEEDLAEDFLAKFALSLFSRNQDTLTRDEIREELKLPLHKTIPTRLFDLNILSKEENGGETRIGFYFSKLRDFIVAFRSLRWSNLTATQFRAVIQGVDFEGVQLDVLNLYYTLSADEHKRVLDEECHDEALSFVELYEELLNRDFPSIKDRFAPYTDESIGFVGYIDLATRSIVAGYGLRALDAGSERVLFYPQSSWTQTPKGPTNLHWISGASSFVWFPPESRRFDIDRVFQDASRELDRITKKGLLDESGSKELLLERVLALCCRYYKDNLGINNRVKLSQSLPVQIDDVRHALLLRRARMLLEHELVEAKIEAAEIDVKREGNGSSCSYVLTQQETDILNTRAEEIARDGIYLDVNVQTALDDVESMILKDLSDLEELGESEISTIIIPDWDNENANGSSIINHWKPATIKRLLEKLYLTFLDEYLRLVERNFPTLCNSFDLYRNMPVRYFFTLESSDGMPTGNLYRCRNSSGERNAVVVCESSEVVEVRDRNRWAVAYAGVEYECFARSASWPEELVRPTEGGGRDYLPFQIYSSPPLRILVYTQIRNDLRNTLPEFARQHGASLDDRHRIF